MIRPVNFAFNSETAANNAFQIKSDVANVQLKALEEFDRFVLLLKKNDIDVTIVEDTRQPYTPDSIFPNNWISFHNSGTIILYPMFAPNRRAERKERVLETISQQFNITGKIDLSFYENEGVFLEGTGSMVLDRDNRISYACLSPRTDQGVLEEFCKRMNYEPVVFTAVDDKGQLIYHTNVMMCVADKYVVICLDSVPNTDDKKKLIEILDETGKEIIDINYTQLNHFAGNMLQVENNKGEKLLVMSTQAYQSLTNEQVEKLSSYNRIIHSSLNTIETNGGGSARCMMAEIHLPPLS